VYWIDAIVSGPAGRAARLLPRDHEDKNQGYRVKNGSVVISSSCMARPCVRKRLLEMKRFGLCARQTLEDLDTLPRS
jgi:hypothetical protein